MTCAPPVFLLTGPCQGGKTTCLREITTLLKHRRFQLAGFITHGLMEAGDRTGFNLEDLRTGECTPLSRITPEQGAVRWGRFYFFPEGIKAGNHALQDNGILHPDLTVVDEVGPFELQRGIWAHHLDEMAFISPRPLLWVVRAELVNDVIERWRFSDPQVFTIPVNAYQAADVIAERITTWNTSSSIALPDPDQNLL